jgi:hypothetical protein
MSLHESTFGYLQPTEKQISDMSICRAAAKDYLDVVDKLIPEGPDKTYLLRKFREVAMWVNVAITRQPDGSPRV